MSYDIYLNDPTTGETIEFDHPHDIKGGTYACGGTSEAWLNVTYNYSKHFYRTIDKELGIRKLYGMSGAESIPLLENAIGQLKGDVSSDYWESTEGNARRSLHGLLAFAKARPDGTWNGD
jgi:hypothetical protein